jgi:hypothetical protein
VVLPKEKPKDPSTEEEGQVNGELTTSETPSTFRNEPTRDES